MQVSWRIAVGGWGGIKECYILWTAEPLYCSDPSDLYNLMTNNVVVSRLNNKPAEGHIFLRNKCTIHCHRAWNERKSGVLFTHMIKQKMHIYKYVQLRIIILQQHVSATLVTTIRVSYSKNTINVQYTIICNNKLYFILIAFFYKTPCWWSRSGRNM